MQAKPSETENAALKQSAQRTRKLLRASALIRPDATRLGEIHDAARQIADWNHLAAVAEEHNMAPILHHHLRGADDIDPSGRRLLGALAVRHRGANTTLTEVAELILRTFSEHNIGCIVLKGMALSHTIYPDFRLRPMRDIDLLVPREDAARGQSLLGDLGFTLPDGFDFGKGGGRYMRNHHHLPIASLQRDGMQVSVELHTDALSGDYPESFSYDIVEPRSRNITIGETAAKSMGHADMLTHLLRHALEPAREVRLGGINDIVSYAAHFADEIDWESLRKDSPYTMRALSLLHHVSALPPSLAALVPADPMPDGAGFGMRPLGTIFDTTPRWGDRARELLNPPEWWLRAYYGADASTPARTIRWKHHAPRLIRWFFRRVRAAAGA